MRTVVWMSNSMALPCVGTNCSERVVAARESTAQERVDGVRGVLSVQVVEEVIRAGDDRAAQAGTVGRHLAWACCASQSFTGLA